MNDKTILRIRVPKHLYESVKAQLTLKEAKDTYGVPEGTVIKEKKTSSDGPKKSSAPKKANAPVRVTQDNAVKADRETGKMGASVSEKKLPKAGHKKMGVEELKSLAEMLKQQIAEMEGKESVKEGDFGTDESEVTMNEEEYEAKKEKAAGVDIEGDSVKAISDRIDATLDKIKKIEDKKELTPEDEKELKKLKKDFDRDFDLRHSKLFPRKGRR